MSVEPEKRGSDEVVIRYEKVCKRFGPKVVLQDLDLAVRRGETLAIMGPSGIGKSVTLRHAVGLLQPDSGRVLVEGRDMATIERDDLIALRRRMGYLFQDGALIDIGFPKIQYGHVPQPIPVAHRNGLIQSIPRSARC